MPWKWYELLRESNRIEQILNDHWAAMGQYDTAHRVKLVVDEYGPWYRQGSEVDPTHIFGQQITMRDALATALTLDTFNRNADKVMMATCAQLVNNLNALFLAHEDSLLAHRTFMYLQCIQPIREPRHYARRFLRPTSITREMASRRVSGV